MKYLEFTFHTTPCTEIVNDVLSAVLGEAGFESFVEQTDGITAYIQKDLYNETALKEALADFPLPDTQIEYAYQEAEDKDWNEEWEKNFFQPIIIGDRCVIHSTFHRDIPQAEYDIVINPQMAFGTGHHETTSLIIGELLDNDLQGKSLLDMGCGTSILAISKTSLQRVSLTEMQLLQNLQQLPQTERPIRSNSTILTSLFLLVIVSNPNEAHSSVSGQLAS